MMNYLEQNDILSDKQLGTEKQMLLASSEVTKWVSEGKVVDMAYLDLSKAFDVVAHLLLLDKLYLLSFDLIVTSSVSVSGTTSLSMSVTYEVLQGSVWGPLLFLIYVKFIMLLWLAARLQLHKTLGYLLGFCKTEKLSY